MNRLYPWLFQRSLLPVAVLTACLALAGCGQPTVAMPAPTAPATNTPAPATTPVAANTPAPTAVPTATIAPSGAAVPIAYIHYASIGPGFAGDVISGANIALQAPGGTARLITTDGHDYLPQWAPDGRHLLFLRPQTQLPYNVTIMVADATGANIHSFATLPFGARAVAWSTDGTSIVYLDVPAMTNPPRQQEVITATLKALSFPDGHLLPALGAFPTCLTLKDLHGDIPFMTEYPAGVSRPTRRKPSCTRIPTCP